MQKELNDVWENKDIRNARMNSINNASSLIASFVNAGFYKTKEEALEDHYGLKNKIFDWIYQDMETHSVGTSETPCKTTNDKEIGSATDKQKKAVWAICRGSNGKPELESELPDTIDNLSFEEASNFIEKYGRKK